KEIIFSHDFIFSRQVVAADQEFSVLDDVGFEIKPGDQPFFCVPMNIVGIGSRIVRIQDHVVDNILVSKTLIIILDVKIVGVIRIRNLVINDVAVENVSFSLLPGADSNVAKLIMDYIVDQVDSGF